MVVAEWKDGQLTVSGHADDARVCTAVSSIAGTLYVGYQAPRPRSGWFYWDSRGNASPCVTHFVLNYFRQVAESYPSDFQLHEAHA